MRRRRATWLAGVLLFKGMKLREASGWSLLFRKTEHQVVQGRITPEPVIGSRVARTRHSGG
jgi:hypothetical protein